MIRIIHGLRASYAARHCRCPMCVAAQHEYAKRYYRDKHPLKIEEEKPGVPEHGTRNGYNNHGCRCEACKEASRTYLRVRAYTRSKNESE